ncbi:MAG: hypothetical protein JXM73_12545, partial [Anaerolineae bacterium]|nr:hypothetical protein [Anaerolineae bacterium]
AGVVFAQGPVDDGDGVRDLVGQGRGHSYGFVDEDGDGVNDRNGSDCAFVDEDGDGLCDVCGGLPGEGEGQGEGYRRGEGTGSGNAYGRGNRYGLADDDGQQTQRAGRGGFGRQVSGQ